MVEINNQRKAFLDMLAGRRELITDVRKPEIMVMTSLWASYLLITPITLANLSPNPKLKSTGAGRFTLLSRWWDAYRKQLGLKDSLRKVRTLWHCSRLKRGAACIDRGDIRQAIDRCSNIWASLPGAGYGQFDIRLTAWLQNSKKRAERSERLMYEQSHRDYLRSGYLHHRLPVMGC